MRLVLHIGTQRTRSAGLRRWCAANVATLEAQGVWHPQARGGRHHDRLVAAASADGGRGGGADEEALGALDRDAAQAAGRGARVCLMSSDLFWSRLNSAERIARLHALLAPRFEEIEVRVHLRPQVDLLVSQASQEVRDGHVVDEARLMRPGAGPSSGFYGYDMVIGRWEDAFGASALRITPFRRAPDPLPGLLDALGVAPEAMDGEGGGGEGGGGEGIAPDVELDWRAIALSNAIRRGFAELGADCPPLPTAGLERTEPLALSRAQAVRVQARFAEGNARLAARRPELERDDLEPDWRLHGPDGTVGLVDAPCLFAPQLAELVRGLTRAAALQGWRRGVAEGRLAAMQGDAAGVERALRDACQAAGSMDRIGLPLDPSEDRPQEPR